MKISLRVLRACYACVQWLTVTCMHAPNHVRVNKDHNVKQAANEDNRLQQFIEIRKCNFYFWILQYKGLIEYLSDI